MRKSLFALPMPSEVLTVVSAASIMSVLSVLCCGCSAGTDYWTNRLDDMKDIVSFTAGNGFGIKVQAGPIQADSMYNYAAHYGLRGGEFLPGHIKHSREYHVAEGNIGVPLLFCNAEIFFPGKHAADRGKAYCAVTPMLPVFILLPDAHTAFYCNRCSWKKKAERRKRQREKYAGLPPEEQKKIRGGLAPLTEEEKKALKEAQDKENPPNLPFDGRRAWYKYSDIEVTAALGGGFSIGINPGELLDFLAGFAGLDLYRDDI
jgi:hypothetical protein